MKTGLLHVAEDRGGEARVDAAIQLAKAFGLHLTGTQAAPLSAYAMADPFGGVYPSLKLFAEHEKRQDATRASIEERLRDDGVSFGWVRGAGSPAVVLLDQSRLNDLIILSHLESDEGGWDAELDLVGDVAVHSRAPILSVPYDNGTLNLEGTALVAWNASFEAAQALRFSVPLLSRASLVQIVTIGDEAPEFPASGAAAYLSHHGIKSELLPVPLADLSVGEELLNVAIDTQANFVVLGAYGHSRIRERILGGVTREMLLRCPKPLLLAH
ncbi:universal stress protein [Sphingomonas beigongshangi]|uniref:universal stress protein n=1 Tax=Sphingomonas beigongshangi TaxID=2782540 RepID=UPI001AEE69A0|nr:universal stress protein [Sphingomonas beigongshangi]